MTSRYDVNSAFMGSERKYGTIIISDGPTLGSNIKSIILRLFDSGQFYPIFHCVCRFCLAKKERSEVKNPLK